MKPHKHAELIKAWADGAEIEYKNCYGRWLVAKPPLWDEELEFRIKPEPKADIVVTAGASVSNIRYQDVHPNLKLIFDGETLKLKDTEILE